MFLLYEYWNIYSPQSSLTLLFSITGNPTVETTKVSTQHAVSQPKITGGDQ